MLQSGKLISWNDDKGFGFIAPDNGGDKVFVHISAFANRNRRPVVGTSIQFTRTTDDKGRIKAATAQFQGRGAPSANASRALVIALGFVGLLFSLAATSVLPWLVPVWVAGISLITWGDYALDKRAAQQGGRRTPENRLHLLALFGGWPGALYAQQSLRHKSAKTSFRVIFYLTIIINLTGIAFLACGDGHELRQTLEQLLIQLGQTL